MKSNSKQHKTEANYERSFARKITLSWTSEWIAQFESLLHRSHYHLNCSFSLLFWIVEEQLSCFYVKILSWKCFREIHYTRLSSDKNKNSKIELSFNSIVIHGFHNSGRFFYFQHTLFQNIQRSLKLPCTISLFDIRMRYIIP